MTIQVPLTNSDDICMIDESDFALVSKYKWMSHKRGGNIYACTTNKINGKNIQMHRMILNISKPDCIIDHKDGYGLNNTRGNIRVCTRSQNLQNSKRRKSSKRTFRGVSFDKATNKWRAMICVSRKNKTIAYFETERQAASAYDAEALKLFGEFAKLNNIQEPFIINKQPKYSKYYGVAKGNLNKWRANIVVKGKKINLGCSFCTEDDAAVAYNKAAIINFGEKCNKLNNISI